MEARLAIIVVAVAAPPRGAPVAAGALDCVERGRAAAVAVAFDPVHLHAPGALIVGAIAVVGLCVAARAQALGRDGVWR